MQQFKLNAKTREGKGRGPSRRLRAAGYLPAVIYGPKTGARPIAIKESEFRMMMRARGDTASLVQVYVDDEEPALSQIKDFQRNAVTQRLVHVDIYEVDPNTPMTAEIPVRTKGEPIGVLNENGTLDAAFELTVRCLPKDLPQFIEVDVSELHVGDTIHIEDLPEIPGVTFPPGQSDVVASCVAEAQEEEPPAPTEEEAAAAAAAEGGEAGAEAPAPAEGEADAESKK